MLLSLTERVFLAGLLAACLASFAWGMNRFFERPAQRTRGMLITQTSSVLFAALHFFAIASSTHLHGQFVALGAVLYAIALTLFWWAIQTHGSKRLSAIDSPDAPKHLVEEGPYVFVRHPFYASYLLTWVAGAIACSQWWLVPTVLVMLAIYLQAARYEEKKFSLTPLAKAYAEYRNRTGLFLPNPLKFMMSREFRRGTFDAASVE